MSENSKVQVDKKDAQLIEHLKQRTSAGKSVEVKVDKDRKWVVYDVNKSKYVIG